MTKEEREAIVAEVISTPEGIYPFSGRRPLPL